MKRSIIIILTLLISATGYYSYGQVEKGFEVMELVKIMQTNRYAPNISYSVSYEYADDARPGTVLEAMSGQFKFQQGKYAILLGDALFVQGNVYNVAVYEEDSTIVINERSSQDKMMQLPVLDSSFRDSNIDSLKGVSVNDSINRIQAYFKSSSYYAGYEISYNKNSYVIDKIIYRLRENAEHEDNPTPSGVARVTLRFTGYSYNVITPDNFNEDLYIYKITDGFAARAPYSNFQVISNVGN